jgi:protein-disulfide isomerase/uncharacterized membrane protein
MLLQEHHFLDIEKKSGEAYNAISSLSRTLCGEEGKFFDCGKVAASEYSSFSGVPVAVFGVIYFFAALMISIFLFRQPEKKTGLLRSFLFGYFIAGSAASIILLIISISKIKAVCTLCSVTYISAWFSLFTIISIFRINGESAFGAVKKFITNLKSVFSAELRPQTLIIFTAVTVSIIAAAAAHKGFESASKKFTTDLEYKKYEQIADTQFRTPPVKFNEQPIHISGSADALVEIVKFSDFMCPACSKVGLWIEEYAASRGGKIRLMFFNFPLDKKCNPIMKNQLHEGACEIHKGAVCAEKQGAFQAYYNAAFSTRHHFVLSEIAAKANLKMPEFQACMASAQPASIVQKHIAEGMRIGIRSTPSVFINGKQYKGPLKEEIFDLIIEKEIQSKIQKMDVGR